MAKGFPSGAPLTQAAKTHCPKGHAYAEHGVLSRRGDGRTFRKCGPCVLADTHRRRGPEKATHRGPRRKVVVRA